MAKTPRFAPYSHAHSLEHVAFGIDTETPFSSAAIAKIHSKQRSKEFKKLLPFCIPEKANIVRMPLLPFIPGSSTRVVDSGLILVDSLDFEKSKKSVYLGDGIQIVYKVYDRWDETVIETMEILKSLLTGRNVTISSIFLEFKDKFLATDDSSGLSFSEILKPYNDYLPKAMNSVCAKTSWKNTFAAFGKENHPSLDNIAIEYLVSRDGKSKDYVSCTARHTYFYRGPREFNFNENNIDDIEKYISELRMVFSDLYSVHTEKIRTESQWQPKG
jgi:hypothetical protein